jgi:hypothetical protein
MNRMADLQGALPGGDGFRVVIPTRDSAPWIAALADAYDRAGVRPLFIVDRRSSDGTGAVLRHRGCDVAEVLPAEACVEDIVWRISSLTDARWVLRINDDEMPSAALLQWVRVSLHTLMLPAVAFPRRWAWMGSGGRLSYAEHRQLYWMDGHPEVLDPQVRLFQPDRVHYVRTLRTPGFSIEGGLHIAPPEAFICHFDWLARSFAERHAKLVHYETALAGYGLALRYLYLPELLPLTDRCEEPFPTDEFDSLAAVFARCRRRSSGIIAAA